MVKKPLQPNRQLDWRPGENKHEERQPAEHVQSEYEDTSENRFSFSADQLMRALFPQVARQVALVDALGLSMHDAEHVPVHEDYDSQQQAEEQHERENPVDLLSFVFLKFTSVHGSDDPGQANRTGERRDQPGEYQHSRRAFTPDDVVVA